MQFNDVAGNQGICQEVDSLCDSDAVSYPLSTKVRRANSALETLVGKIIGADGTWQFDDSNYTDLPIGIGNLFEGQSSYSFATKFLQIENVKVMDARGKWHIIKARDQVETTMPFENYYALTGFPQFYDKDSDTLKFGPAPGAAFVTLTGGLKVQFKRTASLFTTADTTKEPGFASPWHIVVAKMMALPYCKTYKKDRVPQLMLDITADIKDMLNFYGQRERDGRNSIKGRRVNPR